MTKRPHQSGVRRVLSPLLDFVRDEAAGGVALIVATIAALLWANLGGISGYESFWHSDLRVGAGSLGHEEDLRHWVNDGLMALFFFVVGLEIKRELVTGELRDRKAAALPALAAVGGVVVPALIFLALAGGGEAGRGWGIPMATDIAFAVGVLAALGSRIPSGAKLFLLSIAIVDDIIAVLVIAIAYTETLRLTSLAGAVAGIAALMLMRRAGVTAITAYIPVGIAVWYCTLQSGVHATIAGVVVGLLTPARPVRGRDVMAALEHRLHPISAFVIVPLFALANAGVSLSGDNLRVAAEGRVAWAVAIALVVGKIVGISGATWLALRLRIGTLPESMTGAMVWGVATLGGIGFTVSLFITELAYESETLATQAKVGIFAASFAAAVAGVGLMLAFTRRAKAG